MISCCKGLFHNMMIIGYFIQRFKDSWANRYFLSFTFESTMLLMTPCRNFFARMRVLQYLENSLLFSHVIVIPPHPSDTIYDVCHAPLIRRYWCLRWIRQHRDVLRKCLGPIAVPYIDEVYSFLKIVVICHFDTAPTRNAFGSHAAEIPGQYNDVNKHGIGWVIRTSMERRLAYVMLSLHFPESTYITGVHMIRHAWDRYTCMWIPRIALIQKGREDGDNVCAVLQWLYMRICRMAVSLLCLFLVVISLLFTPSLSCHL